MTTKWQHLSKTDQEQKRKTQITKITTESKDITINLTEITKDYKGIL